MHAVLSTCKSNFISSGKYAWFAVLFVLYFMFPYYCHNNYTYLHSQDNKYLNGSTILKQSDYVSMWHWDRWGNLKYSIKHLGIKAICYVVSYPFLFVIGKTFSIRIDGSRFSCLAYLQCWWSHSCIKFSTWTFETCTSQM